MYVLQRLAIGVVLLAVAHQATAAQPGQRRPARSDRYDPFQEDDTAAAGRYQDRGGNWIGSASRSDAPAARDRPSTDRYRTHPDAPTSRSRTRYDQPSSDFRPVSYEPEYVIEGVDTYEPTYAGADGYCEPGYCDVGCGDVGCGDACAGGKPGYQAAPYCWTGFGEYLLLRPRGLDVAYAVEQDNSSGATVLTAPVQQADPSVASGFRAGIGLYLSPCERFDATFTHFESDDYDDFDSSPVGTVLDPSSRLQSLTVTQLATEDWDTAAANAEVSFQLLDFDYRRHVCGVEWSAGIRIAWLDQDLWAEYDRNTVGVRTGLSSIDFRGAGLRFGFGKEHRDPCLGWLVYAKGHANFMGGEFQSGWWQYYDGAGTPEENEAATSWEADRLVTTFDLEMGFGWEDPCGRWRFTAGYLLNYWMNVVTTDEWLTAVETNQFDDLSSNIGFDGLAVRGELRF